MDVRPGGFEGSGPPSRTAPCRVVPLPRGGLWRWGPWLPISPAQRYRWRRVAAVIAIGLATLAATTWTGWALWTGLVARLAWMELWTAAFSVAGAGALIWVWPVRRLRPSRRRRPRPSGWRLLRSERARRSARRRQAPAPHASPWSADWP